MSDSKRSSRSLSLTHNRNSVVKKADKNADENSKTSPPPEKKTLPGIDISSVNATRPRSGTASGTPQSARNKSVRLMKSVFTRSDTVGSSGGAPIKRSDTSSAGSVDSKLINVFMDDANGTNIVVVAQHNSTVAQVEEILLDKLSKQLKTKEKSLGSIPLGSPLSSPPTSPMLGSVQDTNKKRRRSMRKSKTPDLYSNHRLHLYGTALPKDSVVAPLMEAAESLSADHKLIFARYDPQSTTQNMAYASTPPVPLDGKLNGKDSPVREKDGFFSPLSPRNLLKKDRRNELEQSRERGGTDPGMRSSNASSDSEASPDSAKSNSRSNSSSGGRLKGEGGDSPQQMGGGVGDRIRHNSEISRTVSGESASSNEEAIPDMLQRSQEACMQQLISDIARQHQMITEEKRAHERDVEKLQKSLTKREEKHAQEIEKLRGEIARLRSSAKKDIKKLEAAHKHELEKHGIRPDSEKRQGSGIIMRGDIPNQEGEEKTAITIDTSDVIVLNQIASRRNGSREVMTCLVDGWLCAVKVVTSDVADGIENEIGILSSIPPHPNLVRFFFFRRFEDTLSVYMMKYHYSLQEALERRRMEYDRPFDPEIVSTILLDVARGIEFLHAHHIVHRDLNARHILVSMDDEEGIVTCAVAHFDHAFVTTHKDKTHKPPPNAATKFQAPEVLSCKTERNYDQRVDIYMFGILIYQMLTLCDPYEECKGQWEISQNILAGKRPIISELPMEYQTLVDIFIACTQNSPSERPSLEQVMHELLHILPPDLREAYIS